MIKILILWHIDSILFVCIRSASSLGFNKNEICGNRFEKAPKATTVSPTKCTLMCLL